MTVVQQGDILRISGLRSEVLVLSKNFFNETGFAIVCPILHDTGTGALNIAVFSENYTGVAHLENLKSLDLTARHFQKAGQISYGQIQNISDAVQGIFDYYPYGSYRLQAQAQ